MCMKDLFTYCPLGFTALIEKFCNASKNMEKGTDQLMTILNSYLTPIVQSML